jgi:plasmid stability protein
MTTTNTTATTKPISIALDAKLHRRVKVYAASVGTSVSRLVRDLLSAAVSDLDAELATAGIGPDDISEVHEVAA